MTGWIIPPPKKPVKGKDEFKTLPFSKKATRALKKRLSARFSTFLSEEDMV